MRDYKNVRVPKKYRSAATTTRASVKSVTTGQSRRSPTGSRGMLRMFLAAAMTAAGVYLGWHAYDIMAHSDMFLVSGVNVKGVKRLSEDDLKDVAGVFTGQNIFRADIDAAARRLSALPWVREARIHRRLPNKISIEVMERNPAAVLETGKARYLIDDGGVAIERAARVQTGRPGLPLIIARDARAVPGEPIAHDGIAGALQLIAELAKRGGWRLSEVTVKADSVESLSVLYAQNEFRLGAGNYSQKLRRLAEVTADLKKRDAAPVYIDLRPERQVAVMVKK